MKREKKSLDPNRKGPPPGTQRTVRLELEYDGGPFVGWQRQANGVAIQELLEEALAQIAGETVTLFSASRTDAGVHACQQVVSFGLKESRVPVQALVEGTNNLLPPEIQVQSGKEAELGFHATGAAKEKEYKYFIWTEKVCPVFFRNYCWHLRRNLDRSLMQEASKIFIGEHDFAAFRNRKIETKTSIREVRGAKWEDGPFDSLCFRISAGGFLRHMVRNLVGTLVEVGEGKRTVEEVREILLSKDRKKAGLTAPPQGLFLWSVKY